MAKGGGGAGGGGGGGSAGGGGAATAFAAPRDKNALPDGVQAQQRKSEDGNPETAYNFKVGDNKVEMTYERKKDNTVEVAFKVNNSFEFGALQGKEAIRAVIGLKRIHNNAISQAAEGTIFKTSGFFGDSSRKAGVSGGERRNDAYSSMGFSKGKYEGATQYGVIKGGKLVPSTPKGKPLKTKN